jgi:hypothetical protein
MSTFNSGDNVVVKCKVVRTSADSDETLVEFTDGERRWFDNRELNGFIEIKNLKEIKP